jgi:hypothetical protein
MLSRKTMSVLILLALVAVVVGVYSPFAPAARQQDGTVQMSPSIMVESAESTDDLDVPLPDRELPATTSDSQAQRSGRSIGSSSKPSNRVQRTVATRSSEAVPIATFSVTKDAKDELQTTVYATGDMTALTMMEVLRQTSSKAQYTLGEDGKTLIVVAPAAEHKKISNVIKSLRKNPGDPNVREGVVVPNGPVTEIRPVPTPTEPVLPGLTRSPNRQEDTPEMSPLSSMSQNRRKLLGLYYGRPAPADPEMAKLELADATAGKKVAEIVKAYRTASGEEQQVEARLKLKTAVDEHFAVRQQKRALEISRLEARLEKIRQSIAKRDEAQEQIVGRHISKLLGEAGDLEF